MSLPSGPVAQSPAFSLAPSTVPNANSPDARAHSPPPPPDAPPPNGAGEGYPVVPPAVPPGPSAPVPVLVPAASAAADPAISPSPVNPSDWAVAPSVVPSRTPDSPSQTVTVADVVATWKADAQHTSPPDPAQTAQVAWSPTSLPFNSTLSISTVTNGTLSNSTSPSTEVSAPSGLAIAGITIPLILSSFLLLLGISYCARKRSRAATFAPRTSDLEEGKSFEYDTPYGRSSLASSLIAARGALEEDSQVAYPGYDAHGVSVIARGGMAEMRQVPTFNITHASPIAPHANPVHYRAEQDDGSVIFDEPTSFAVQDMRAADASTMAPNVLYSDAAGNVLAPLGSLMPVRVVESLPPPSAPSTRCLTPRSAAEMGDTLADLPRSSYSHVGSHAAHSSHSRHSNHSSSRNSTATSSAAGRSEPWKCQDCGSAKLLRSTSVDRQSSLFGSTYWSPSRRSTLSTDFGGYEEVCSCPPKSVTSTGSRATSRTSAVTPSSSSSEVSRPCSCSSSSCQSITPPRPPPPSLTRQARTRRRSSYDSAPLSRSSTRPPSSSSSPELPASLRLGRPSSASSSSGSSTACTHTAHSTHSGDRDREKQKAAAKWLHHVNGNSSVYGGSIATEGHGHGCPSHSHHSHHVPSARTYDTRRSYTGETARSANLPSPWAPLRTKAKREEWRWERVPVAVYDALERTETRSTADTADRMWRR